MPNKDSKEFAERKAIVKLQHKADTERHEFKMAELEYQRKSDAIRHDKDMERQKIKSAEIRKAQMRRQDDYRG